MSVNASHDAYLAVVLSTRHRVGEDYSKKDRQMLSGLAQAARSVGDLPPLVDGVSNHELRSALGDLRHRQQACIASGMRAEVAAIMTQWPIPEATLGWEQRRHVATARPSTAAPDHTAFVEQSTAWRGALSRARAALLSASH